MTSKRIFRKFGGVMLGLFGLSILTPSCAKEKTCTCSYSYAGASQEIFKMTVKTKDDCSDIDIDPTNAYPGTTLSCKE